MLGSDRFTFETPNVIDPGDLPPTQPQRVEAPKSSNSSSHSRTASVSDDSDEDHYREARHSAARLLSDIGDLDLTPSSPPSLSRSMARPYDPYDDDDDDAELGAHHSLPHVDDARLYAASLLVRDDEKRSPRTPKSPLNLTRTVRLRQPSTGDHLLRKRMLRIGGRVAIVLAVLAISIGIGVGVSSKRQGSASHLPSGGDLEERRDQVRSFLVDNGVTSQEALEETGSPQALAAEWITSKDLEQRQVPAMLHSQQRFVQRYVLAVLYYALGGDEWKEDLRWLTAEDECAWYDNRQIVDYVQTRMAFGVTCNEHLFVKNLFLPKNNLVGSLPPEIRFLTGLDLLSLPYNAINGRLPNEMAELTGLNYLDLKYNKISGYLPGWIGDLEELEVLGLSNNEFAGSVPVNFGTLARLKTLGLDDNALTGDLTFASHLDNLEYFWADRNLFEGFIGNDFLANMPKLRQLDLSFNALKGANVPEHLLQHPTLEVLDLSDNTMIGGIPDLVDDNMALQFLSLRKMGLHHPLPTTLPKLRRLTHLDLFGNEITGTIPNDLGEMVSLNYLFLGQNNFNATSFLPPFLSQLFNLRELSLSSTNIGGQLEGWLSYLKELRLLDLSNNSMVGEVPQEVWDLPELRYLLLNNNDFSGTVPTTATAAAKMQILSLYHTDLQGDVNYFCESNGKIDLLAADCTMTCSTECCPKCCKEGATDCFEGTVSTYLTWYEGMWEFNYTRASYSYDPAILQESGVAYIVNDQP